MKKNNLHLLTISLSLSTLILSSCSLFDGKNENLNARKLASVNALQPPLILGEKWSDEDVEAMNEIGEIFHDTLIKSTGDNKLMRRDAHPKHHGCVSSRLEINNSKLPKNLRVGLLAENKNYNSIVRFSNGDPDFTKSDLEADVRGMAIKILETNQENYLTKIGVENSNVHDIVMMNADAFFIPNPEAYVKFMRATKGRWGVVSYLLTHWNTLGNILKARKKVSSSLDIDYSTATPYRLGDKSVKMKFVSCKKNKESIPKEASENFLSERLESYLKDNEGCFDFYVQVNRDEKKNNIENALLFWDEKSSPMIKVGRLTVNKQSGFRSEEKMSSCEDMTFNPWRAPEENRPLGGVNRIRLEVYLNQSKLRLDHNGKN